MEFALFLVLIVLAFLTVAVEKIEKHLATQTEIARETLEITKAIGKE